MLSSTAVGDAAGKASCQRSAFSQTCSLLSQYVKEKRGAVDLSLGMACNIDGKGPDESFRRTTIMNLFPVNDKPKEESALETVHKPVFAQHNMFPSSYSLKPNFSSDAKSAQMTIFYNGQVIVFDDFPAEKAKEVMEMASKGSSHNASSAIPVANQNNPVTMKGSGSNPVPTTTCPGNNLIPEQHIQLPPTRTFADLPISRKASLHRFLEKRKDRITANAPYSKSKANECGASKANDSFSWLGLAAAAAGGERKLLQSQSQL